MSTTASPAASPTASTTATSTETSSGRHPVNVGHLVMGIAFLGLVGVWALIQGDVVGDGDVRWLLPVPWVLGGAGGLLAVALGSRRRRATYQTHQVGWIGETAGTAPPATDEPDQSDENDQSDESDQPDQSDQSPESDQPEEHR